MNWGKFQGEHSRNAGGAIADTDFDVVSIGRAMLDHNNGCGVQEGLACADCWKSAKIVTASLRERGYLGDSPGPFSKIRWQVQSDMSGPWHFDLEEDHPYVVTSVEALGQFENAWSEEPVEFSKVAVSALIRAQRLERITP